MADLTPLDPPYFDKPVADDGWLSRIWLDYFKKLGKQIYDGAVTVVTGTPGRIAVTGTQTNPVVNIDPAYVASVAQGGTGQSAYTLGDTLYADGPTSLAKLAGVTAARRSYLGQRGSGSTSMAPEWIPDSVFNVTDPIYGAKGDGLTASAAANTIAIQAAYNAARANVLPGTGGAEVYIPAGRYYCGALLFDSAFVSIRGDGMTASELITNGNGTSFVKFYGGASAGNPLAMACFFEDIKITQGTGVWTNLLHVVNLSWMTFNRFWLEGSQTDLDYCFHSESALTYWVTGGFIIRGGRYDSILIEKSAGAGQAYPNAITMENGEIQGGQTWGLHFKDGASFTAKSLSIEHTGSTADANHGAIFIDGVDVESGSGWAATLEDIALEDTTGCQIKFNDMGFGASYACINRVKAIGAAAYGLYMDASSYCKVYVDKATFFNATVKDIYVANKATVILRDSQSFTTTLNKYSTAIPAPTNGAPGQITMDMAFTNPQSYADNATTQAANFYSPVKSLDNTGATNLYSLTGCNDGTILTLYSSNGNTTLIHRHSGGVVADEFDCPGNANYKPAGSEAIYFIRMGGHWWPINYPQDLRSSGSPSFNNITLAGNTTVADNILTSALLLTIRPTTSDGSDNGRVDITGGGADSIDRGAYLSLRGNENSGTGKARLAAGNVTGGTAVLATGNDVARLTIDDDGFAHFSSSLDAPDIHPKTSDGSDNGRVVISGGGADGGDVTRGAYMKVSGNEASGTGGVRLGAGNVTGGKITLATGNDVAAIVVDESQGVTASALVGTGSRFVQVDSTGKLSASLVAGSVPVVWTKTASTTLSNSTTETTLLDTGVGSKTIAANLLTVGKSIEFEISGVYSTTLTPTIQFRFKLGSTVLDSGAVTTASTVTNKAFCFYGTLTCRSTGAGGTIFAQGGLILDGLTTPFSGVVNTATASVDTTGTLTMDITAQWGSLSVSDSITATNATIKTLG